MNCGTVQFALGLWDGEGNPFAMGCYGWHHCRLDDGHESSHDCNCGYMSLYATLEKL